MPERPTTDAIRVLICAATTIQTGAPREWTEGPYDTNLSSIDRIHKTVRVTPRLPLPLRQAHVHGRRNSRLRGARQQAEVA
jgi:hypothetical protein